MLATKYASNKHLTSVDNVQQFVIVAQKIVCIAFCRVISQQHSGRGVPRIWEGGGPRIFFSDLGICMSRSDMLRMAKPCALLGGFGGMLPRENFLKRCNLVRFRVYFDQILSLFFSKKCHFLYKK